MRKNLWLVTALTMVAVPTATAAPPDVKTLFPAGGQRGQTVEVTVGGKLNARPVSVWTSRPGVTVEVPDEGEKVQVAIAEDVPTGVTWLRFHNAEGAAALRPFIVGTLPEVVENEPNNEYAEPQALSKLPVVVNGKLEKNGDVDTFAVSLTKGQTLVAALDANQSLGSPMDGVLQVVSPRGFVLVQNDDGPDLDPLLVFTPDEDGTYLVRLFAFPSVTNSSIRLAGGGDYVYRLTLTTGPFIDHVAPLAVTRGTAEVVRPSGWNLGSEGSALPLEVEGESVAFESPFPLRHGGITSIRTVPHAAALEDASAAADQPQPLEFPIAVTGHISEPGEVDVFAFAAKKDDKLTFRVQARALGSPMDPSIELRNAAGERLSRVDDGRRNVFDPELEFKFPEDGEYRLRVTDVFGHGGFRYVYLLTAGRPQPDYELSLKSDMFQLTPGKPLEIPVSIERSNGLDGEVEISVEGLPEHVTAAPAKSLPKGDSSKSLKLKLETAEGNKSAAFAGPIRIVGRIVDQPESQRVAGAPISGQSATTADLWLTVTASN